MNCWLAVKNAQVVNILGVTEKENIDSIIANCERYRNGV